MQKAHMPSHLAYVDMEGEPITVPSEHQAIFRGTGEIHMSAMQAH